MEGITVFYPMYNEELYIRRAVEAAKEVCELMLTAGGIPDYEVLIVDDASGDATGRIADELSSRDRHVSVVHHPANRGLGGSLKTGFSNARMDVILYSDTDLPFDMMELKTAYRLMRYYEADIVSAFRFDRTGEGLRRLVYSYVYNSLIQFLFGLRIKDVNFSFKLVKKEIFEYVKLRSEGSFIDAELLIRAHRYGYRIIQFGTNYFPRSRGVSTLSSSGVIMKIVGEMISMYGELRSIRPVVRR
ncbi:MAG: glycosyltransferase family 2 protein [Deltaproteobacteria bacterium]|nr:glycosyltransferase family 2 protein [Deltaproteobacteria bacterium]MCL5277691.1 glycosyltransferase family 2 protein [Deltaproteobacteria bacterium]